MKRLNSIGMLSVLLAFGTACGSNSSSSTPTTPASQCVLSISPSKQSVPIGGGNFNASVTAFGAPCNWTASADASCIGIKSGSSGTAAAQIAYSVPSNSDVVRQGAIVLRWADGSASIAVDQDGVTQCIYNLSPSAQTVPAGGGSFRFTVTRNTQNGCSWSAETATPWISLTGAKNGLSPATITYSVDRNSSSSDRSGAITVIWHGGNASFVVAQPRR